MPSTHFLVRCSCGTVINQCRCPGQKTETVVKNGCKECTEATNAPDQQGSTAPAGSDTDNFLMEMTEALVNAEKSAQKYITLHAYTSAEKSINRAECLRYVISRYKQNRA